MSKTRLEYLRRELQIMDEHRSRLKEMRNGIESNRMPDIQWLVLRLSNLIQEMNIRIDALRRESANTEANERIMKAREKHGEDADKG